MTVTFTITDDNSYSLAFLEYIKKLDFIKNIKIKDKKATSIKPLEEDLEEDEYGMPIKYRDEIMALSKQANRNMTKRWEAAIAKIIFSCFYTPNGAMATILKNERNRLQFIAPSYLLEEVKEHLPILMERNHLTKKKALDILKEAIKNITFYDLEEIKKKNREKAAEIAKDIDPDDYLFIALHFETGHKIWTCDAKLANGLKEKGYDMCITTNEIREKTYKKKE